MKKIMKLMILIMTILIFSPSVFALEYISLNKTNVSVNEEFEVTINLGNVTSWNVHFSVDGPVEGCEFDDQGTFDDPSGILKTFTKTCSATDEGTVTFNLSGDIVKDDGTDAQLAETKTLNVTKTDGDSPVGLSSIRIEHGSLTEEFDTLTKSYIVNLDSADTSTFSIVAVANTSTDRIVAYRENDQGNEEEIQLSDITFVTSGNNATMLILIRVGDENRQVEYSLVVNKPASSEIGAPELATLTVGNKNITLYSGQFEYPVTLDNDDIIENGGYMVNATLKDDVNYAFDSFLVPPQKMSGIEFIIKIIPKDTTLGLSDAVYVISVNMPTIDPVEHTTSPVPGNGGNSDNNPVTGSTLTFVVGIMLIASFAVSMLLYRKNINGYQ